MKRIVFLVSGGGGNMRYVFHALSTLGLEEQVEISAVIADRDCGAIDFAKANNVNAHVIQYTRKQPEALNALLADIQPDVVITNIHKILDTSTLQSCSAQFINLHYSLLPAYAGMIGMDTVAAAKVAGDAKIGVTTHKVSEAVDAGEVLQQAMFTPQWETQAIEMIQDTVFQAGCITIMQTILTQIDTAPLTAPSVKQMEINGNTVTWTVPHFVSPEIHATIYKTL